MRERASERAVSYIDATSSSLKSLKSKKLPATVTESQRKYVLELARGYVRDARYYSERKKPVTSLACIAYAEGLFDALKFLKLVDF